MRREYGGRWLSIGRYAGRNNAVSLSPLAPHKQKQVMTNQGIYIKPLHVGPESIDILEHVNNKEYLRWMEEVATEHAASNGWDFEALRSQNVVWVARQHWIEYLRPALLGDELTMYTWVQSWKRLNSLRRYALKRGEELLMVGATEWVMVDYQQRRPARIPEAVSQAFTLIGPDSPLLVELNIQRLVRFEPSPGL